MDFKACIAYKHNQAVAEKFSGKAEDFPLFRQLYEIYVYLNQHIPDAEKMEKLLKALPSACVAISHLQGTRKCTTKHAHAYNNGMRFVHELFNAVFQKHLKGTSIKKDQIHLNRSIWKLWWIN